MKSGSYVGLAAIRSWSHGIPSGRSNPPRTVAPLLDDVGYVRDIQENEVSPQEFTRQLDLAFVEELAEKRSVGDTVAAFVVDLEREFASYTYGATREAVRLSTYHLAKGLEWQAVFLPALNDGELPYWRSKEDEEIAEERRLFYVGMTRAKRVLELSTNGIRFPSRFLDEVLPAVERTVSDQRSRSRRRSGTTHHEPITPRLRPDSWRPW
jgi:superfamily I DNA/RNA helicase